MLRQALAESCVQIAERRKIALPPCINPVVNLPPPKPRPPALHRKPLQLAARQVQKIIGVGYGRGDGSPASPS